LPGPVGKIVVSFWHAPLWGGTAVLSKAVGFPQRPMYGDRAFGLAC